MTVTSSPLPDPAAALADWALWYASQGWSVVPAHTPQAGGGCSCQQGRACGSPGKHPRVSQRQASTNAQTIRDWWGRWPDANIILMASAFCVLDIDIRNGGDLTMLALRGQYGDLPDGPRVISGSGGDHYYFALPPGGCATAHGIAPGIDLQAFGHNGCVVAPPSLHASGRRYAWDLLFSPDAFPLPELPGWVVALAGTRQRSPSAAAGAAVTQGLVIPEGGRANYLIRQAARLRNMGFSEEEIYQGLQIANQHCQPPQEEQELRAYAQWAGKLGTLSQEQLAPSSFVVGGAAGQGGGPTPAPAPAPPQLDHSLAVPAQALMRLMMVPPRFLIENFVPDGLTILAAPSKSFKTYFALSLALATLGVQDWCGTWPAEETGNVVFFALESSPQQLRIRLHQLCPQFNPATCAHQLTFFTGMRSLPNFRDGLQGVIEEVIDRYDPRLVVIDPMSYLYRLGRSDEMSSATIDLLWPLADMAAARRIALFAPEHMRKASKEDVSIVDRLAGSHMKSAIVHALLTLGKDREEETLILSTTMRDAPSQEVVLTLEFSPDGQSVTWGYRGQNQAALAKRENTMRDKALLLLQDKGIPLRVGDIIDELDLPRTERTKATLRKALSRAEQDGEVSQNRRGEYVYIRRATP